MTAVQPHHPVRVEPAPAPTDPLDWPGLHNLHETSALQARVARVPKWFHIHDLPGGVRTPGVYDPAAKLHRVGLPSTLHGQTVLDVGAWDGFYSFECERRGAARVTSVDIWDPNHNATSEGYAVAHHALRSRAHPVRASVFDLDPITHGHHDLVLFLGVLYHLTNPLEALMKLRPVCKGALIVETASDFAFSRRPALAYHPGDSLSKDDTNHFSPNARALIEMCLAAGFREAKLTYAMPLPMRAARAVSRFRRFNEPLLHGLSRGRIVVRATV